MANDHKIGRNPGAIRPIEAPIKYQLAIKFVEGTTIARVKTTALVFGSAGNQLPQKRPITATNLYNSALIHPLFRQQICYEFVEMLGEMW